MPRTKQLNRAHPVINTEDRRLLLKTQQRYGAAALLFAVTTACLLIAVGQPALGKGLVLGTLFSVINFMLMAVFLPLRIGIQGRKNTILSLVSIVLRYALLTVPLVWAHLQQQYALSTVAVGLFMVQITILSDHLWTRMRNPVEAKS